MGVSCSCETKDDYRENKNNNYNPLAATQPQPIGYNPNLNKNEYQIMNKTTFEQTKKDAFLQGKILVALFGRMTDSKCKEVVPALVSFVLQKYPNQTCTVMIDCDNSQEILKDDISEQDKDFPWTKVYSNVDFMGVVYDRDETGLEKLIQEGIIKLSASKNNNNSANQMNELNNNNNINNEIGNQEKSENNNKEKEEFINNDQPIEQKIDARQFNFESFFKGNHVNLKTSDDLKGAIEKSLAEQKVLFVNFSKEDELSEKIAASFELAAEKYSADIITAICNAVLYEEVVQSALEGGTTNISFPFIRTYVNGKMWEDCFGESKNLEMMLDYAIAAIVKNNNNNINEAFDYGQQKEFAFTTITSEELFNNALETADSENKALIIYISGPGADDGMASKFDILGAQYSGSNCCFAKADINEATFIMNQVEEGALPIIQAYVKKAKINEIRGSSDELKSLIDNALAQVV